MNKTSCHSCCLHDLKVNWSCSVFFSFNLLLLCTWLNLKLCNWSSSFLFSSQFLLHLYWTSPVAVPQTSRLHLHHSYQYVAFPFPYISPLLNPPLIWMSCFFWRKCTLGVVVDLSATFMSKSCTFWLLSCSSCALMIQPACSLEPWRAPTFAYISGLYLVETEAPAIPPSTLLTYFTYFYFTYLLTLTVLSCGNFQLLIPDSI